MIKNCQGKTILEEMAFKLEELLGEGEQFAVESWPRNLVFSTGFLRYSSKYFFLETQYNSNAELLIQN